MPCGAQPCCGHGAAAAEPRQGRAGRRGRGLGERRPGTPGRVLAKAELPARLQARRPLLARAAGECPSLLAGAGGEQPVALREEDSPLGALSLTLQVLAGAGLGRARWEFAARVRPGQPRAAVAEP